MNPWLITWEPSGDRARSSISNLVAAILPNRTSQRDVKKIMYLLYANYSACSSISDVIYVSEQLNFAKRHYPYKAIRSFFPHITCGHNPFLFARPVHNLKVANDEEGYEILSWEENIYPYPPKGMPDSELPNFVQANRPFKRKRRKFFAKTNTID